MLIDILYAILMVYAVFKGWTKGVVVAVFAVIALLAGLAAALKLSASLAVYLENAGHFHATWLPAIAFLAVFIGVVLLVRLGAKLIEKALQLTLLGWLNRLCGVILYACIYTVIFSVLLWMANQLYLITPGMKVGSRLYSHLEPVGPVVIGHLGKWIPLCKNIFHDLQDFFGKGVF